MHNHWFKLARFTYVTQAIVVACTAITLCFPTYVSATTVHSVAVLEQHFSDGDYPFIINALAAVQNKTPEQYNLYISALMNQDLDDAEAAAEDFIAAYSHDYRAYHTHANVMGAQATNSIFSALGYAKKAKHSLEKAVTIAPQEIEVYQALMQFHLVAPGIAGGDMDIAESLTDKIANLDAVAGKFAKARFYLADKQDDRASEIYRHLIAQQPTKIKASFELGSHYLSDENYQQAFAVLSPLLNTSIAKVSETDATRWQAAVEQKRDLLYAKYRIGQVAAQSGEYTDMGIKALQQYIAEVNDGAIDTTRLPSMNWAYLRLAQLRLNANQLVKAKSTLSLIQDEEDKRFSSILKGLKKQIKKRA